MILRICSYFTLFPGSVGITRVVKIALRFGLTGMSFGLLFFVRSHLNQIRVEKQDVLPFLLYGAYVILGVASILWSTEVTFTVLQLLMLFECIAFVWLFYSLYTTLNLQYHQQLAYSKFTAVAIALIGIGFMIGLLIDPSTFYRDTHGGAVSRLGGYIINPNELGMLAVLGAAMNYMEFMRGGSKGWNSFYLLSNIAVLLLTQSRSSLISFVLLTGMFVLISGNFKIQLASVISAILVLPIVIKEIVIKDGDVGEVMSMTGRLPFWSDLITHGFPQRPILGYGFMSISPSPFTNKFDSIHAYAASMTHNTFVQVLINLGLVGAFIVILQMTATFRAIIVSKDNYLRLMSVSMLIPLIINSITEFGIFGEANYGIMFYQFIILFFTVAAVKHKNKSSGQLIYSTTI